MRVFVQANIKTRPKFTFHYTCIPGMMRGELGNKPQHHARSMCT